MPDLPAESPELRAFAAGYDFPLDPYQVEACRYVEAGSGVLVAAPTGAGKTVVGEFAVHLALGGGRKCFYTTPIKALSNQKHRDLVARYGSDRVGLLTGDTTVNSEASVVVMTTEVLRNMIYAGSPTLRNLGYVVMDEVHYLADRFRGAVWEEVILGLAPDVQLVSLSATVSNAEEFGDWLNEVRGDVRVVLSERRPVPLFQHVIAGRRLYDLFAGEGVAQTEVNPELVRIAKQEARGVRDDARRPRGRSGKGMTHTRYGSGSFGGAAARDRQERSRSLVPRRSDVVRELDAAGLLPAIYFIFSRQGCDAAVRHLLGDRLRLTTRAEAAQLDEIARRHAGGLNPADLAALHYDEFADALRAGIAAHHAGLLPAFKECVEEAFGKGLVKVVFATETLALGINMPARSVVLERLVKYNGETHADITPGEYTQLTGRAGRRGIDVEGHAVVCWQPGLDPRALAGLASRRTYPLRSSFTPTYNMAVNLVGSAGRERARLLLEQSFAQFQSDASIVGVSRTVATNRRLIAEHLAQAACDRGDFAEYARLRSELGAVETAAARQRKADRRAEAHDVLLGLKPGDILFVPGGRRAGWVVVIDPGDASDRQGPKPLVLTADRQVKRLTPDDFPTPGAVAGRVRIPKHFDPRRPDARRSLQAAFRSRLAELDPQPERYEPAAMDAAARARVVELRAALAAHPCADCPDRENHARWAEQALRIERETDRLQAQIDRRTNTIGVRFDRICGVLESLGYLDGNRVTDSGRVLARLYTELDLVTAECLRGRLLDALDAPQVAAVLSSLVYESRAGDGAPRRMPDRASEAVQSAVRRVWRDVADVERDFKVDKGRDPDIGFAEAAFAWCAGRPLTEVLDLSGLTAGDFVRWARQVIDFAGQVAVAAAGTDLQATCREVVYRMRRGVVDVSAAGD
ncbi:DEAD/DEAH box helicase [Propionicicella superfundia]|uniref:DEAD/DEAH box helicase n=1 Tax=Propionicicella superfundia TaxID=348582 RepID=UPI0003F69668